MKIWISECIPPDDNQFFKSTGELFRKYPPLVSPPQKTKTKPSYSRKDKQPMPDKYEPAFYTSPHKPLPSDPETEVETDEST